MDTVTLTLFLREWEKQRMKTMEELRKMDLFKTISSAPMTNVLTLSLKDPTDLYKAVRIIKNNPSVTVYYTEPDYLKEVADSISSGKYFNAYTLCISLYESLGKKILIKHFKGNINLSSEKIDKLGVYSVIVMLYTQNLIQEGSFSEMVNVNNLRNDLIHKFMTSMMSEKFLKKIKTNSSKLTRSLEKLYEIHEGVTKK